MLLTFLYDGFEGGILLLLVLEGPVEINLDKYLHWPQRRNETVALIDTLNRCCEVNKSALFLHRLLLMLLIFKGRHLTEFFYPRLVGLPK